MTNTRKLASQLIQGLMCLLIIVAVLGIPYLVFKTAWSYLAPIYDEQPWIFALLVLPAIWLCIKVWKWLSEISGVVFLSIGRIVDKLEE